MKDELIENQIRTDDLIFNVKKSVLLSQIASIELYVKEVTYGVFEHTYALFIDISTIGGYNMTFEYCAKLERTGQEWDAIKQKFTDRYIELKTKLVEYCK